jgi:hypothetical protein
MIVLSPALALLFGQGFFEHVFQKLKNKGGGEIKEKSVGRLTRYSEISSLNGVLMRDQLLSYSKGGIR